MPNQTNYYGRLCIPDAGIDVGLYCGAHQEICDRQDSANIFAMSVFDGLYIADHNTQAFEKLVNIKVGMRGYLKLANGVILDIVCTDVLSGHNIGNRIVDQNGNTNLDADYLMYTCEDSWHNILICLWKHD
jgi:sortase (surface protein transpeptidase)